VYTLRGKGAPRVRSNGRGDEHIIVNVEIPAKLTKEQRELFEQLATSLGTATKPQQKGFFDKLNDFFGG
jgi:molecular chaperone DnaJ